MSAQITITNLVGVEPYNLYLCDSSFGGCIYITTINDVDIPYSFLVPISYLIFSTVGVKIIDNQGCVITGLVDISTPVPTPTPVPLYKSWTINKCDSPCNVPFCACVSPSLITVYTMNSVSSLLDPGVIVYTDSSLTTPADGIYYQNSGQIYEIGTGTVTAYCLTGGPC